MENPLKLLDHLQFLTNSFLYNNRKIFYINIYSRKENGGYVPIPAKNEGIACVDDLARAVLFAFEIYEFFGIKGALEQAEKWLSFLEYMQDSEGYLTNFISNKDGEKKYGILSSFKGGPWWSARAKWAWAKAFVITKNKKYLDFYLRTKILGEYQNNVAAILLLGALEVKDKEDSSIIKNLLKKIASARSAEGYFIHQVKSPLHLWGYHELEAVAKYSKLYGDKKLAAICDNTADTLVKDVVDKNFYFEFNDKNKSEVSPYCVSPLVRGLYELYKIDNKSKYFILMQKCFTFLEDLYDSSTGRCYDWISKGKIASDCGAEASIEAGYCWIRRIKLDLNANS